jgi:predicted O-methyltransferase YrrM
MRAGSEFYSPDNQVDLMKKLAFVEVEANSVFMRMVKLLRLNDILNYIIDYAPKRLQNLVSAQKQRYRVRNRRRLLPEGPLSDKYREVLLLLAERRGASSLGDYLEFGVYNGTSLICMHRVLGELGFNNIRLFGFDSFEGLPKTAAKDDEGTWYPGQFCCDYEFTKKVLNSENVDWNRTFLIKGWFSDTLNDDLIRNYNINKASVIMVDCDMYLSAKEALRFCASLIQKEAVILFDDWYSGNRLADRNLGEKRAFDEFLSENGCFKAEELNSYTENAKVFLITREM